MKARLIKNESGKHMILYSDGSISYCTEDNLYDFLRNFKHSGRFYGSDGTWKTPLTPDMMIYPGETCAVISDDLNLLIMDFSPFDQFLSEKLNKRNYISAAEYGAKHNRSAEIIKLYCRDGRIPGAKQVGSTWVVPEDAEYPIAPHRRRDDLSIINKKK